MATTGQEPATLEPVAAALPVVTTTEKPLTPQVSASDGPCPNFETLSAEILRITIVQTDKDKPTTSGMARNNDSQAAASDAKNSDDGFEKLIPGVRITNYEGFKNFNQEANMHIVQALKADTSLRNDIQKEKTRRESKPKKNVSASRPSEPGQDNKANVLHRIRIHSPCVLSHLYHAAEESCPDPFRPLTFFRPFKILIHYQLQMKEALERLDKKWGDQTPAASGAETNEASDSRAHDDPTESGHGANRNLDSKDALTHLRVYVKFMEEEVMTLYRRFDPVSPGPPTCRKVLFSDLWYLFREGDWVHMPAGAITGNRKRVAETGSGTSTTALQVPYQTCMMVYAVITPETPSDPEAIDSGPKTPDDGRSEYDDDPYDEEQKTRICCYYIDFDGDSYGPVTWQISIRNYEGEKNIRSLIVYPTRFMAREQAYLDAQKENGKKFKRYIEQRHLYHRGWTLTLNPNGAPFDDIGKYPEHIDGKVIIDFAEAFRSLTSWKPEFTPPILAPEATGTWRTGTTYNESMPTFLWLPNKRTHREMNISFILSDDVSLRRRNQYLKSDPFMKEVIKQYEAVPSGDHVRLLPRRLVAFSLLDRKFFNVDVNCIELLTPELGIFDKLSIDEHNKSIVRSLVKEHFHKNKRRMEGKDVAYQDLIRGKGTGLVFLLHGVPGVGKTATAEAVAQENEKPLFSITCGDLGFQPDDVEKNLMRIFRLANLWNCILLLDEADVFFTKRALTDLKRNALVAGTFQLLRQFDFFCFQDPSQDLAFLMLASELRASSALR